MACASLQNETKKHTAQSIPLGILCMVAGCLAVYAALFAVGMWLYANYTVAAVLTAVSMVSAIILIKFWSKVNAG